ncbi:telomere length regulation protein [Sporothrix brasiliensis 5110]|uniref:Telomere length regulation protein n=1 Tax=Sporothrix brasiliensis 5110 TaxID=1398154 RepID=A0A0C2IN96_9PEZI|nr:telomere length regulation protein [Sporothrix brasiliensis 5110]KIH88455.1 telomere length regulation protein [Sporothrix brasiliensis 5110]
MVAAHDEPLLQEVKKTTTSLSPTTAPTSTPKRLHFAAVSADEALDILRNEPDYDSLVSVLQYLLSGKSEVDVRQPTPMSAQVVQVLVTAIVPNYWPLLRAEGTKDHKGQSALASLLACLRSVTGLSALVVRLRALLAEVKTKTKTAAGSVASATNDQPGNPAWQLRILVDLLSELLAGDEVVCQVWTVSTAASDDDAKRRPLAQEYLSIIGGGRIVSLAAESEMAVRSEFSAEKLPATWVANGREYSLWLAKGIMRWAVKDADPEHKKVQGSLLAKALRLGYPDTVVSSLVSDLILINAGLDNSTLSHILDHLPTHEQKKILFGVLKYAAETFLSPSPDSTVVDTATVAAVASLIKSVADSSTTLREQLISWLLTNAAVGLINGIGIRRAVVAVVAETPKSLTEILEKSIAEFGDQLFIKHAPIIQQEGMVVGEALSGLIDDNNKKLDFHMDETKSDEAIWYKGLVQVSDTMGSLELLRKRTPETKGTSAAAKTTKAAKTDKLQPSKTAAKPVHRPPVQPRKSGFVIEELDSDYDEGITGAVEDDIVAYGKPDSDAEDSDDDPTMIRRDKPKAPVYIRDLISYFRDIENYDKQKLALATAPVLIRRKATFGTEVQQHAQDLASILVGLQDAFEMADFDQLRLQGMVALVVAQPQLVGPWYAHTFFDGDYSLAQRASVLTAMGLGARELAGFDISEYASAAAFPSKQLPNRMERLYVAPEASQPGIGPGSASALKALGPGVLDSITDSLTATFLRPIAAQAADDATGPDALKLTSFKSRLSKSAGDNKAVNTAKGKRTAAQPAAAVNTSGPLLSSAFFFPLAARFRLALQTSSSTRMRRVLFDPSLLSLYLKTLAVILHAAGPGLLALPDMTAELWRLLLSSSVQARCAGDVLVTHAVLFALMALLDVNENRVRELCRDLPREVVQTREWALQVLDNIRSSGGGGTDASGSSQESEIQMLAAGAYIKLTEGMESYKNLLLGEMIG